MPTLKYDRRYNEVRIRFKIKWEEYANDEDFDLLKVEVSNLIENVKNNKDHEIIRKGYKPNPYTLNQHRKYPLRSKNSAINNTNRT